MSSRRNVTLEAIGRLDKQAYKNHMDDLNFDSLLKQYKMTIDHWIETIRNEESSATSDHSMVSMEKWDAAGFAMLDAEAAAKKTREQYKNALRKKNYGF